MLFHPPAAHEEHSGGDSAKSDQMEQDCQIAEVDAEITTEMKIAPNRATEATEAVETSNKHASSSAPAAGTALHDGSNSVGGDGGKKKRKKRKNKKKRKGADSVSEASMND